MSVLLVLLAWLPSLWAMEFHVANGGNDANPGTKGSPLATLEAARDAVRKSIAAGMKSDVTVHIGAGDYFIERAIVLDDRDGGRDGFTVTYQGAPGLGTRIYGGRRLTGWKRINDHEVALDVPDLSQHFTLYENDQAANGGQLHAFQDAPVGDWSRGGIRLTYRPRVAPIENRVVVLGTTKDVFVIQGRSMAQIAGNIIFDGLHVIGSDFAAGWKKGATDSTTWDGEYDGRAWGGKTLCDAVLAPDMRHGQFCIENARNVIIRNSKLYGAGFMAVMFNRWAQGNRVENCWIENAGCNGVFFMGWECGRGPFTTVAESYVNRNNVIRNNVFHDIGRFAGDGAGVYMIFSGDNVVEHNVFNSIRRYGVSIKGWRPKLINPFHAVNRTFPLKDPAKIEPFGVKEITFYDGYVVTEANQGGELQHARNNLVRFNDFSQIPRDGSDMGMIEMWGAGTGNRWEYNACHDGVNCGGWEEWMHVLFNDDGSHQATVKGNIIYWIAGGGRSRAIMSKGNDQANIHNIIADCDLSAAATIGPFVEPAHDMRWSHNIVAAQIRRLYEGGGGQEPVNGVPHPIVKEAARNLYFYQPFNHAAAADQGRSQVRQQVEALNRAGRLDADSVYADPLFDRKRPWWDARYTDYLLQPDSPALKLAFEQTDMTKIGLQAGFPFPLTEVFAHPAGATWKAADFSRIYMNRVTGEQVRPRTERSLFKDSWTCYRNVDFDEGSHVRFQARLGWVPPKQTFETTIGAENIKALEMWDDFRPIPYWEVSPVYTSQGKSGPELFEVAFAPEKDPSSVTWSVVKEPLTSRATVKHPLGVINCDVVNGENHSQGAAYMRSSVYAKEGGVVDAEIRGAHGVKVWLNGDGVFSQLGNVDKTKRVNITLKKGWNRFLAKVVQDDKPWAPAMQGYGNFWASITFYHRRVGGTFTVPGLPGKEAFQQPNPGNAVEIRLDAPDGRLIGVLKAGQTGCPIEKTRGRHDVFLVFPNENVESMDWFRFEPQTPALGMTGVPVPNEPEDPYATYVRTAKGILDIRPIYKSGLGANHLDVVLVSAGFNAGQMGDFHAACENLAKALLSKPPWSRYPSLINIHAVFVGDDNADSTRLKVAGYKGNVLTCDNRTAVEYSRYAARSAATIVIHNSVFSTASCGTWGVLVVNKNATGAAVHELGHGFAGLGDEYIQRNTAFDGKPESLAELVNVAATANPRLSKWHYWTQDEWPGLFGPARPCAGKDTANFEGAGWIRNIYRPEKSCVMRCNGGEFCAVCNETLEANIYRYIDHFKVVEPAQEEVVLWKGESVDFRLAGIDLLRQPPEWLKSRLIMYVDGEQVARSDGEALSFTFRNSASTPGVHQVGANLDMQNVFIRNDFGFLTSCRGWRVQAIPHARPQLSFNHLISSAVDDGISVPIGIRHEKPDLFVLAMDSAPSGAVLENGRFHWKPTAGQAGSWRVGFTLSYDQRPVISESMEIQVDRPATGDDAIGMQPPGLVEAVTGRRTSIRLPEMVKSAGHPVFDAISLPSGAQLNPCTGELSWVPQSGDAGWNRLRLRVQSGRATREFELHVRVDRDVTPSPVSYCNQYIPQALESMAQLKRNPATYRRLFELLRLLRDRYGKIHAKALAEAKELYNELAPGMRINCRQELELHAWAFSDRPDIRTWMREIADREGAEGGRSLIKKLDEIDAYNAKRTSMETVSKASGTH